MPVLDLSVPSPDLGLPQATRLERARGEARIAVDGNGAVPRLDRLYQSGSAKIRLPRIKRGAPIEAVLLNTAGGLTGGDRFTVSVDVGETGGAVATTQAAERIYRSAAGRAEVETRLNVGENARLDWLPQETILFDRSALSRRLSADLAATATLLAVEAIVLGRAARGERVTSTFLSDSWRIRRAGRLVFADTVRLEGDTTEVLAGTATGSGATAFATLLFAAPDAEERLSAVRDALEATPVEGGASAWNGILVARLVATSGQLLRAAVISLVHSLRGVPMPRVWYC